MAGRTGVRVSAPAFPGTRRSAFIPGFTLVEVMVAVALFVLVVGTVAAAFSVGLQVWGAAANYDRSYMEALVAAETIEREIRSAVPFYAIDFAGETTGLKFCRVVGGKTAGAIPGKIEEIAYRFDGESKSVTRSAREFPWAGTASAESETVLAGVIEVRLSYADWPREGRDNLVWRTWWKPHRERLPAAVALQLVLAGKGGPVKINRTVYLPRRARTGEETGEESA